MERKYYRLAHQHRMTLNVLPYSQRGSVHWRSAPKVKAAGVTDWREWDGRYGPLLSGEVFSKRRGYVGPGEGTPIRHIYLPFHENWPVPLAKHFRPWPPPKDYGTFQLWSAGLPAIEASLSPAYRTTWRGVLGQFVRHLAARKWSQTRYQVYLNNKYYFRRNHRRGISLWLLDEPMFADDFLALRQFAGLTSRLPVDFRIDISRPTHQRNWLDGLVDLNVCPDQLYAQRRWIAHRKRKFGEEYWNYRMPASFGSDNLPWAIWPIRSYCWGATGTLPWQTIGSDGDLYRADATALMYPGRKFGLYEPVPSLRMKAWRQGLQTAELLRMLKQERKWGDVQLRAFVGQVCGLTGWRDGLDPPAHAPIVTFFGLTSDELETLKRATINALSESK
jgi:hypothetical protein